MQTTNPPVILIFGPFDPSGSSSLLADTVTFAHLGCHAVCASTATMVRDSACTEDIQPTQPEYLDDQARFLLEDMAVKAIKVGPIYSIETISVVAQIAADYSDLPLILQPAAIPYETLADDIHAEEAQQALIELLLPQTDIVVTNNFLLKQWLDEGLLPDHSSDSPAQGVLKMGAGWILVSGESSEDGTSCNLYGQNNYFKAWPHPNAPQRLHDCDGPLACALTAALSRGITMETAVKHALNHAAQQLQRCFQPGMGNLFYDRSLPWKNFK